MPTRGFSVRLYYPSGDPRGLRVIERFDWTGSGVAFPRPALGEAKEREELKRTGVYVLWDRDPRQAFPKLYVGQSDKVIRRLVDHDKSKDFWTDAVAFTSSSPHFNNTHARYLESELIRRAKETERCTLDNSVGTEPPELSEAERNDVDQFLEELLLCLPMLGLYAFEQAELPTGKGDLGRRLDEMTIDYRTSNTERLKGILATGYQTVDEFVVRKNSHAAIEEAPSFINHFPGDSALRAELVTQGVLVPDEELHNAYRFTRDVGFNSPSRAAQVVNGSSSNGRVDWEDAKGRSLNDLAKLAEQEAGDKS